MKDRKEIIGNRISSNRMLWTILCIALLTRLLFFFVFPGWDDNKMMDSARYTITANHINMNRGFVEQRVPSAFVPPLYPYFIAGVQTRFGTSMHAVKLIQILISVMTVFLIYLTGSRLFNQSTGLVAAGICAVSLDLVVMAGTVYSETLYIVMSVAFLHQLSRGMVDPKPYASWIWAGLFLGLATLTRHILMGLPFVLIGFSVILPQLRIYANKMILMTLVTIIVITPWLSRNYVVFDRFVPIAEGAGGGLYHGTDFEHDGRYRYEETRRLLQEETAGVESRVDQDRVLIRKSVDSIRENPLAFLSIASKKFVRFFVQIYENVPQGAGRTRDMLISFTLALGYYPMALFAFVGMALSVNRWRTRFPVALFVFYSATIYALTLVTPRYRIPLLPMMFLFSGHAIHWLWVRFHPGRPRLQKTGS